MVDAAVDRGVEDCGDDARVLTDSAVEGLHGIRVAVCSLQEAQSVGDPPAIDAAAMPGVARRLRQAGPAAVCITGIEVPGGGYWTGWIASKFYKFGLSPNPCQKIDSYDIATPSRHSPQRGPGLDNVRRYGPCLGLRDVRAQLSLWSASHPRTESRRHCSKGTRSIQARCRADRLARVRQLSVNHHLHRLPRGHKCGRMHGHGFEVIIHANQDVGAPLRAGSRASVQRSIASRAPGLFTASSIRARSSCTYHRIKS